MSSFEERRDVQAGYSPCSCDCHIDNGSIVMHCMPCCAFTYEKYINEDGTLNQMKWDKIKEEKE